MGIPLPLWDCGMHTDDFTVDARPEVTFNPFCRHPSGVRGKEVGEEKRSRGFQLSHLAVSLSFYTRARIWLPWGWSGARQEGGAERTRHVTLAAIFSCRVRRHLPYRQRQTSSHAHIGLLRSCRDRGDSRTHTVRSKRKTKGSRFYGLSNNLRLPTPISSTRLNSTPQTRRGQRRRPEETGGHELSIISSAPRRF